MTAAEQRRIDNLINVVAEALDEPPPPEVVAFQRSFLKLPRAGPRRVLAMWALADSVKMLKAGAEADAPFDMEVQAARRWALDMGRTARRGGAR